MNDIIGKTLACLFRKQGAQITFVVAECGSQFLHRNGLKMIVDIVEDLKDSCIFLVYAAEAVQEFKGSCRIDKQKSEFAPGG